MSWWLKSFFKSLGFCQGNTFENLQALEENGEIPQFLFLSLASVQKNKYELFYSKQVKFRNVTVIHDIHMIKIYEDSAMQKKIHNLAPPSSMLGNHKVTKEGEWCFLSENSEECLQIMLCLHIFYFLSETGNKSTKSRKVMASTTSATNYSPRWALSFYIKDTELMQCSFFRYGAHGNF